MKRQQLIDMLNKKAEQYNHPDFIDTDPIQVVHRFTKTQDIEIMGLLTATIAWGNRTSIIRNAERLATIMEAQPHAFITQSNEKDWQHISFVHRTFQTEDLLFFLNALKQVYHQHESLEELFIPPNSHVTMAERIHHFRTEILKTPHLSRSAKHLSDPLKGSAAKRINMYLRWMVRNDAKGVDFGIWSKIPMADLRIPLDVHTGNVARKLGLLTRKQNDWKALEEIHAHLDEFNPNDPAVYDYALFGLGAFEGY
jgi:uncharacterized protein (TIGR02757 family)